MDFKPYITLGMSEVRLVFTVQTKTKQPDLRESLLPKRLHFTSKGEFYMYGWRYISLTEV